MDRRRKKHKSKKTLLKRSELLKTKKRKFQNDNYYKFSYYKIIILVLLLFLIIIQEKKQNSLYIFFHAIISEKKYDDFEKMKSIYSKDPKFKPFLEQINIIDHIHIDNYKKIKMKKNNIHICNSLNNKYIYPILVSMESVLMNCNKKNTYIIYHILCSPDLTEDNLSMIKSLINKYSLNLEIIFYNMGDNFMNRDSKRYSQATYYKILTPIFVDTDRILYLDGDTLTFKDLNEMYQMDFNNNYVLGTYDYFRSEVDYLGIKSKIYINAGVIILNLEKIRNDKMHELIDVINNNSIKLRANDQTLINYVFYPNIGRLPSKYNIFNFYDESDIRVYLNIIRTKVNYYEVLNGFKDPTIIHNVLCWPKLWSKMTKYLKIFTSCSERKNCDCKKYYNLWYSFAENTDYYNQIINYYEKKPI